MKKIVGFTVLLLSIGYFIQAQNKVLGILGSSTAEGIGASVYDSSWAGRLDHYYRVSNNVLQSTVNLGQSGGTPYIAMPDGYVAPSGRPEPNPEHNITRILKFNPDVVIISFVSNEYNTYSFEEIRFTLETIRNIAAKQGKIAYVTTSQPRTNFGTSGRAKLRDVKDSIIKWFGAYSINFYDSIVNPVSLAILDKYSSGDGTHLNDAGHAVLFRQVVAKKIFTPIQSILNDQNTGQLKVRGNPSGNSFQLEINSDASQTGILNIIGMNGAVVKKLSLELFNGSNIRSISIPSLPKGNYIIQLQLKGKNIHSGFIKAY